METRRTIWETSRHAATGRPAKRSRADFVAAAIAVAERDGLAAVTMRRIGSELGTGAASAYRHVGSRDDLVDLMIDQALEAYEPPRPTGEPYDDVAAEFVHRLRFIRDHGWLIDAVEGSPRLSPQRIRQVEIGLERLASHPASGPMKVEALTVLAGMLMIQARNERVGRMLDPDVAGAQMELLQRAAGDGSHPHLGNALAEPASIDESADERFRRVLRRVLEGLLSPTS